MSAARVTVEWMYKEIKLCWTSIEIMRKSKVRESPIRLLYIAAMFLTIAGEP